METKYSDFLIIGSGIIGLSIAKVLSEVFLEHSIIIIEKEDTIAQHASGRNSGVLHAGFYYTEDSLKAKFTKEGNLFWRSYCLENHLRINECKKVVVCKTEEDLQQMYILKKRGDYNSVPLQIIDEKELQEIEPNATTYQKALLSPLTATVDPFEIANHVFENLRKNKVQFLFKEPFKKRDKNFIYTKNYKIFFKKLINCAGLYSDCIAKEFGLAKEFTIVPFKGIYLDYTGFDLPVRTNIYPVPDLRNPFLGVHITYTAHHKIKLGPTAIPAFWREQYSGFSNFYLKEFLQILFYEAALFFQNQNFRCLALREIKKYDKKVVFLLAKDLVRNLDFTKFKKSKKSGIRAQLLNLRTKQLVNDFLIQANENSIHILNAISPAFTAAIPFAKFVVHEYLEKL